MEVRGRTHIGRTVEATMLEHLCRRAAQLGCTFLRGTYSPTQKNAMAADAFAKHGFERVGTNGRDEIWSYDLAAKGLIANTFVTSVHTWESADGAS